MPTVDLASRYEVGAVVLHSALMSGMRVAFPQTKRTWFFDAFPSIDKASIFTHSSLLFFVEFIFPTVPCSAHRYVFFWSKL